MPRKNGVGLAAIGRLMAGAVVCGAGLVTVAPPATTLMWQASIILAEWGHWIGLLSLLLLLRWYRSWLHGTAATLTMVGIVLLCLPVAQAYGVAARLTDDLHAAFGIPTTITTTDAPPRPQPLVASDLMFGVSKGDVIVDEHVYNVIDGQRLALDLYRPEFGVESRPVVMVIHGGGWNGGTKREFQDLSRYLAARGYVVANIDYRLAPADLFPAPQEDLLVAIRYVKDLETTHGVDPTRIALLGRSVGGQIAMLGAYTSTDPSIRGVVSIYGPAALRWGYHNPAREQVIDSTAALEAYLGGPPETHGTQYDAAEPARFVTAASPPTLFIHGLRDEHVSPYHAETVSARLLEVGVPHVVLRFPWATHGCDYVFSGPCGQLTTYAVEQFLGSILRGPGTESVPEDPTS